MYFGLKFLCSGITFAAPSINFGWASIAMKLNAIITASCPANASCKKAGSSYEPRLMVICGDEGNVAVESGRVMMVM